MKRIILVPAGLPCPRCGGQAISGTHPGGDVSCVQCGEIVRLATDELLGILPSYEQVWRERSEVEQGSRKSSKYYFYGE